MNSSPTIANSPSANSSFQRNNTSGLSTGAKAAIGVCVPIGAILIAAGAFYFGRSTRRESRKKQVPDVGLPIFTGEKMHEAPPQAPKELPTKANTAELEGTSTVQELPGSPL